MTDFSAIIPRLTEIVNAGLVTGVGVPVAGKLCIQSAICLALGEPHSDQPTCVAEPDRSYQIRINDAFPGTPAERAELLLPLGIASLGTAGTDRVPWVRRLAEGTVRRVVPIWLRAAAEKQPEPHRAALLEAASRCERDGDRTSSENARGVARAAAAASSDAAAYAASAAYAAAYRETRRQAIRESVAVALEAYRVEGRA